MINSIVLAVHFDLKCEKITLLRIRFVFCGNLHLVEVSFLLSCGVVAIQEHLNDECSVQILLAFIQIFPTVLFGENLSMLMSILHCNSIQYCSTFFLE